MVQSALEVVSDSPYSGCCVVLTTKHQKSLAFAPSFDLILGAGILEHIWDTDQLGTFTGDIERKDSPLETARKKCELGVLKAKAEYALASEGSFSVHPQFPIIPLNQEILYFIDKKRDFSLFLVKNYLNTNYQRCEVSSLDELYNFACKVHFPSHALIIRSCPEQDNPSLFKGIKSREDLEYAFLEVGKLLPDKKVLVETDMRAHMNPTRMEMIRLLGEELANRLNSFCPKCSTPGWGQVDVVRGLLCFGCGLPTKEIKAEIYGCAKCPYKESLAPKHGKNCEVSSNCANCNP